ncbi:ABC transporter substrate-binding protein [Arachidicoccus soli]|uniref:Extracellular solute-binding protein n=1 Tax=Arachidicoccus soli TaxID=2341117 RepID=A0A386HQV8_9BACT|nr:extracellular solute-binding protein [Arachidicoccus soli]AYD47644.1 extracellular solute-binding protein [Arachidicoccus soli]
MQYINKKLRVAVRKFTPFENALEKIWHSFKVQTNTEFELEYSSMDLTELHQSLFEEGGLQNGSWDIVQLSSDWVSEAFNKGAIEDLAPFIAQNEKEVYLQNWPPSLRRSQTFENKIYGIPFHDGPECMIYRTDLFESEENKAKFKALFAEELEVPKSWGKFLQVATFFSSLQQGFYGTALAAFPDGHNAVYDFCIQAWSRGGVFLRKDNSINIDIPQIVEGLNFYRDFIQSKNSIHPQSKNFDSVRLGQAFANGEIAMMINWFGFAAYAQLEGLPKVKNNVGVCEIPTDGENKSISPNSYWIYSIAKGSQNKHIAYEFISFATNQINDCILTLEGGIGCRLTTYKDEEINRQIPFFNQLEILHSYATELPNLPQWASVAHHIDNLMLQVMNTNTPIELLVKETQKLISNNT